MSTNNLSSINQLLSVYIPYFDTSMDNSACEVYIKETFQKLNIGKIDNIIFRNLGRWIKGNMIEINMEYWNINNIVEDFQRKILDPLVEARIIHDDPDYWIILPKFDVTIANIYNILINQNNHILNIYSHIAHQYAIISNNNATSENSNDNNSNLQMALVNNSCCGAISKGWLPSNPSV